MYTWAKVDSMLKDWKSQGLSKPDICVKLANACLGWAYVFGARGDKCTPANRRKWYKAKGKETIKTKCNNFEGAGSCSGCKWYPGGVTLFYDCRGFTYWVLLNAAGIKINGAGATTQWEDNSNWSEKGDIANMPKNKVCCTFRWDGKSMAHTLLYDGEGHYIHDSGEVKKTDISKYSATHYAIPKGLYDGPSPEPPTPTPPTPTPTPPEGKAIVTGKNVALRQGPSTDCAVLIRIATGTIVDIVHDTDGWEYVKYSNKTGFMMKEFISNNGDGTFTVTGKNVALRQGPSTACRVIIRIATGKTVNKAQLPDTWEQVSYQGKTGFMMKQYLNEG